MIDYVLGFYFSPKEWDRKVVLIKKNRPEWMKGKWNVPGGKANEDETGVAAMTREFTQETGLVVTTWDHFLNINAVDHQIRVYRAFGDPIGAHTTTDEEVKVEVVKNVFSEYRDRTAPGLEWMMLLALDLTASHVSVRRVKS